MRKAWGGKTRKSRIAGLDGAETRGDSWFELLRFVLDVEGERGELPAQLEAADFCHGATTGLARTVCPRRGLEAMKNKHGEGELDCVTL